MKKKKILAICLGISFVFSGSFCVFAKVIKKTISGRFKYSFTDGSIDKNDYNDRIVTNIASCENKTNVNHAMALFLWAYSRIKRLKEQNVKISKETEEELLENFSHFCKEPCLIDKYYGLSHRYVKSKKIITSGILDIDLSEEGIKILHKMIKIKDVELTEEIFNMAQKYLIFRIKDEIDTLEATSREMVVVKDLFKKDEKGRNLYLKKHYELCEKMGLEEKIVVYSKEEIKQWKKQSGIYILLDYCEEIENVNFYEVKNKLEKLKWENRLLDLYIFYEKYEYLDESE